MLTDAQKAYILKQTKKQMKKRNLSAEDIIKVLREFADFFELLHEMGQL